MATQHTFTLTIARVDEPVFSGEALSVLVPAADGMMEVLAHHTPLITNLKAGTLTVTDAEAKKESFAIKAGTIEISDNKVTILI